MIERGEAKRDEVEMHDAAGDRDQLEGIGVNPFNRMIHTPQLRKRRP